MWDYDAEYPTFMTMREMARFYENTTSNRIGRILVEVGLRTGDLEPSSLARRLGMVSKRQVHWSEHHDVTTWHFEKTKPFLLAAGLKLK